MTVTLLILSACGDELLIPKPPTYLRSELPPHNYIHYNSACGYHFDISKEYTVKDVTSQPGQTNFTCHKDIDFNDFRHERVIGYWPSCSNFVINFTQFAFHGNLVWSYYRTARNPGGQYSKK